MQQIAIENVLNHDCGRFSNPQAANISTAIQQRSVKMNLKATLSACLFAFPCLAPPAFADGKEVGVMNFTFDAAHRDRLAQSLVFYPAAFGGYPEWLGDNAVFKGVRVKRDAKPERRNHPLIVVSHGSGGNAANLAWLATRLAEAGFVIAIPNHQGSTSSDSTPETTIPAVWERPADISALLDAVSNSPSVSALVDSSDVTVLGFSLGGLTALSLAGAQVHAAGLAKYCDDYSASMECEWLDKGNALIPGHVDLHAIDAKRFDGLYADPRIGRFVSIDPAFALAFDLEELTRMNANVQIVNLGTDETLPTGVKADKIAAAIPGARYDMVAGAIHFDFLGECKRLGWFYVWMEGDDPVCTETGRRSRAELHDEIAMKIIAFLNPGEDGAAMDSRDRPVMPEPKS
jgi:predicted dienelactone hydrolase